MLCILMEESMSVVVNVLSPISVRRPPPCLVRPIGAHNEVMYFWCVCFRREPGFLNCDDSCMCIVNKKFKLIEFVFDSIYVDLKYDEMSLNFTAGSLCLCGLCIRLWSVCEVGLIPYVDAVVAVTMMRGSSDNNLQAVELSDTRSVSIYLVCI